jgi:transglutaminase-like putative cysteine protease
MRFGVVHRLMTNALAALGVLALVSSGQFSVSVSIIVMLGLALALAVREPWQRHPAFRHVDTIALLIVIAVQVTRFALGVGSLDVLIEFAAALQIVRLATRRGAAHDQQVIVLALLHLIAGTVLGGGIAYGLCFAGVLVVAPGALVLSHLRREVEGNYRQGARDRTGLPVDVPRILRSRRVVGRTFLVTMCLLAVPIFVFTATLFVFFPRVGLSLLLVQSPVNERMIGFSPNVDLGKVGVLRENRTVALRVKIPGQTNPPEVLQLHLRGTALDHYDGGGSWSQSESERRQDQGGSPLLIDRDRRQAEPDWPRMVIELEPIDPPVLFIPPSAVSLRFRGPEMVVTPQQRPYALRGPEGELRYHSEERGIAYEVAIDPSGKPAFSGKLETSARGRYLQLPSDLPPRIGELAREWTAGATTPQEKALAIEKHLEADYRWDKDTPSKQAKEPIDHFLFESKTGHCEFFSSSMAVMLRSVGVPTRTVNGFASGKYNSYGGFYVVRQGDAHSWVEVYVDGTGWVTVDPTPVAGSVPAGELSQPWNSMAEMLEAVSQRWRRHVVGYDLEQQVGMWDRFTDRKEGESKSRVSTFRIVVGVLVLAAVAIAVFVVLRRRRALPTREVDAQPKARHIARATAIYETLEAALVAQGVFRSPGTPPLRHAENMFASAHPLGGEVLDITQVYLSVRFGGMSLSDEAAVELERRVRSIRTRDLRADA